MIKYFAKNSRFKQTKKNPKNTFVYIGKQKISGKCQQKIFNSVVIEACQSFQFSN